MSEKQYTPQAVPLVVTYLAEYIVLADADVIKLAQELGVRLRKAEEPHDVQEALRVFDILSAASDGELVEGGSFIRALVRTGEFTRDQAEGMVERLQESGEVHMPKPGHYRRTGGSRDKKAGMPVPFG